MKKLCIILIGILSACILLTACNAQNANEVFLSVPQSAQWMSQVADDALLSSLSIPGTHDSGAQLSGGIYKYSQDQNLTIANQLLAGIRFFDIRLGIKKGKLSVYHGIIHQKLSFASVMDDFDAFLKANPSETILLCIKKERGDTITDAVHNALDEYADIMYTSSATPTLGEVRGKVVLFRRFEDEADYGINLCDGFADNDTFDIGSPVYAHVQDFFNLGSKENLQAEWVAITDCLAYANTSPAEVWVLNFTSAYVPNWLKLPKISMVSDYIHPLFLQEAQSFSKGKYGIILFDFVTEELAISVYSTNL